MTEEEAGWLTVPAAAKRIGIGKVTAYKLVNSGALPSYKISPRGTRVKAEHVDDYIERHQNAPSVDSP